MAEGEDGIRNAWLDNCVLEIKRKTKFQTSTVIFTSAEELYRFLSDTYCQGPKQNEESGKTYSTGMLPYCASFPVLLTIRLATISHCFPDSKSSLFSSKDNENAHSGMFLVRCGSDYVHKITRTNLWTNLLCSLFQHLHLKMKWKMLNFLLLPINVISY